MTEFNDMTQDELDELRGQVHAFQHPVDTVVEDKTQTAADRLRVDYIMRLPADQTSREDQDFLKSQILAGIRSGL